ncbi:MAG TPA: S8 family serine peptidase [Roseiflexaceae bacterium]|nr:S8 family serine peptidase [Roseiflexaceae bacterium]
MTLLIVMLWVALPPAGHVAAATLPASNEIVVTVPLGERHTSNIPLTSLASAGTEVRLFEALPALPNKSFSGPQRVPLPEQSEKIDPQLLLQSKSSATGALDFIVYLADQADLSAAYQISDWNARGAYVYTTLQQHAEQSQQALRAQISARGLAYEPFWIVNAIAVRGALQDAQALAAAADVALVRANYSASVPQSAISTSAADDCSPDAPGNPTCWGIRTIRADRVWADFGVAGQGITVANIDTGVMFQHPALVQQYRGNLGNNRYNHNYNWFDPQSLQRKPGDDNGHGTHTMGTMVGGSDGTGNRPAVGVAPAARWIAAQGCKFTFCVEKDLIMAAQWMLAPTDLSNSNPRPDLRPMIVNNSWAGDGGNRWYSGYTAAWRAAGIFPVFAAGNAGGGRTQVCGSVGSPAAVERAREQQIAATGRHDGISTFSLLGPGPNGVLKPDFTAPGTYLSGQKGIYSTMPDGGYRALQGTSMAAPHVAGVVALLWSANPTLIGDYDRTYAILRDTALRLPDTRCGDAPGGANQIYGNGRIDAYAAVAMARVDVPWLIVNTGAIKTVAGGVLPVTLAADRVPKPGSYTARILVFTDGIESSPTPITITMHVATIADAAIVTGQVLAAHTQSPLAAMVGVRDGLPIATDSHGAFTLTLKPGSYDLVAAAVAYQPQTLRITTSGEAPTFLLRADQPRIVVNTVDTPVQVPFGGRRQAAITLENTGARTLHYQLEIPADRYTMLASNSTAAARPSYQWIDLPPEATTVRLGNTELSHDIPLGFTFPFYSLSVNRVLIASDGMLAFDRPFSYTGPLAGCLPASEIYFYMIAPFRADLDPSLGGSIRYATFNEGNSMYFVVSYENMRLRGDTLDRSYSFQVVLFSDGRIRFQYRDLAELPAGLGVGLQRTPLSVQEVGCGAATPIAAGQTIEFVPQVGADNWIKVQQAQGAIEPGETRQIEVDLAWVRPIRNPPYTGRVRIVSTDPTAPIKSAGLSITPAAAPYTYFVTRLGR